MTTLVAAEAVNLDAPVDADPSAKTNGRYVYCIMPDIGKQEWGANGLNGAPVHTIVQGDICALVHDCPAEPYAGSDDQVKEWVWTHGQVVDAAWAETGSVLPMSSDCIVRPVGGHTADETVCAWLHAENDQFRAQLADLKGKVELGVQVIWQLASVSQAVVDTSEELGRLRQEMAGKPKGMAYFYQQKLEKTLKASLETQADADYRRYYQAIIEGAVDVHVNKSKRLGDGREMLLNLSVLTTQADVNRLGETLEQIQQEPGVEVRFTGPWPPYSFVGTISVDKINSGASPKQ